MPGRARGEGWIDRAERRVAAAVHRRDAFWWLTFVTAVENTVIPLTVEPIVVPLMVLYRDRAWLLAAAMALGSVLGGVAMYAAGAGLATALDPLLDVRGDAAAAFAERLAENGFWVLFIFAASPLPFQAATTGAGAAGYPFLWFLLAITLGRSAVYATFALGAVLVGERFAAVVQKHRGRAMLGGTLVGMALTLSVVLL